MPFFSSDPSPPPPPGTPGEKIRSPEATTTYLRRGRSRRGSEPPPPPPTPPISEGSRVLVPRPLAPMIFIVRSRGYSLSRLFWGPPNYSLAHSPLRPMPYLRLSRNLPRVTRHLFFYFLSFLGSRRRWNKKGQGRWADVRPSTNVLENVAPESPATPNHLGPPGRTIWNEACPRGCGAHGDVSSNVEWKVRWAWRTVRNRPRSYRGFPRPARPAESDRSTGGLLYKRAAHLLRGGGGKEEPWR